MLALAKFIKKKMELRENLVGTGFLDAPSLATRKAARMITEKMKEENGSFYNAAAFDPDNFAAANNPDSFSFFGFGQGPRNCIGKRYAMMTMKLALVFLLRNFELVKTENTQENLKMTRFTAGANVPFRARRIN